MNKTPLLRAVFAYLAILVWAFWMGGFAFYFGIVVPAGGAIVGGTQQGIVTQQITFWLNIIGVVALPVLLGNALRTQKRWQLGVWSVMLICQAALFLLHRELSSRIDTTAMTVSDVGRFGTLHEIYEAVSTVLWLAAMIHAWSFVPIRPASS